MIKSKKQNLNQNYVNNQKKKYKLDNSLTSILMSINQSMISTNFLNGSHLFFKKNSKNKNIALMPLQENYTNNTFYFKYQHFYSEKKLIKCRN